MTPTTLVILSLAAYRLTRLLIEDDILAPVRRRTWEKLPEDNFLKELLSCVWCSSVWISAGLVALYWAWPETIWLMAIPAVAGAAALIYEWEER